MKFETLFITLFLTGTVLEFLIENILEFIDFSFRKKHAFDLPSSVKDFFDMDVLKKTKDYEDDRFKFGMISGAVDFVLTLVLVYSGFYPWLFTVFMNHGLNIFWCAILFLFFSGLPSSVITLPFALYREFKIEKKYGFSKMTLKLFFLDMIKGLVLNLVLSVPLSLLAIFLICKVNMWWLWVSSVMVAFSLLISYIYPVFIAPIFNKFTPLEDGELKDRLVSLMEKNGFKASGIFVMDASKRSGHSNAYFTGFGKNKRIVLFDTLIAQLDADEIEAVLAHELGHCKKHHITKKLCISIPMMFIVLFLLSLVVKTPALYTDFGFCQEFGQTVSSLEIASKEMQVLGLFLCSLAFGGFSIIFNPVSNLLSRKDEFEADHFAKELCTSGKPLISALIKLNKENLSEVNVPKIYSVFNYNHPPLLERIKALEI